MQTAVFELIHLAQLDEDVQLVQTWLIWNSVLVGLIIVVKGHIRQSSSPEQLVSGWQPLLVIT